VQLHLSIEFGGILLGLSPLFHFMPPALAVAIDASRLIISSYVTSLESLLQAQKRNIHGAISGLKLLAVSQPNTPGLNPLPQSTVEVEKLVEAAHFARVHSDGCTEEDILHLPGPDATVSRVWGALDSYSWVHFACHGSHHPTLGMKNALELYDGPLELSDIASKQLSSAQFAFLSACHVAAGLKDIPGEAMHLAAGLQFAGFPSVIATMWSISDDDAATVVEHTYKYLFRNGLQALDPSEAATALNRAILHRTPEYSLRGSVPVPPKIGGLARPCMVRITEFRPSGAWINSTINHRILGPQGDV
jgi:CHAT domain-containing protein